MVRRNASLSRLWKEFSLSLCLHPPVMIHRALLSGIMYSHSNAGPRNFRELSTFPSASSSSSSSSLSAPLTPTSLKEIFQALRRTVEKATPLIPRHQLLESIRLCSDDLLGLKLALSQLPFYRKRLSEEEFMMLLSALSSLLLKTPESPLGPIEVSKALASVSRLKKNKEAEMFVAHLVRILKSDTRKNNLMTPCEVTELISVLRLCKDSWVQDYAKEVFSIGLGAEDSPFNDQAISGSESMSGRDMSLLLSNLRDITKLLDPLQMNLLLDLTSRWLCHSSAMMLPHEWTYALCGLSNLNNSSINVSSLLSAIAQKMDCGIKPEMPYKGNVNDAFFRNSPLDSSNAFLPRNFSRAMYGLRFMDSKDPAMMLIIRKITLTAQMHLNGEFEGKDVARTLYGLKSMSSHEECVRMLCEVIAQKMGDGNIRVDTLQNIDITMACRGLEKLSSERSEVRHLVRVLVDAWRARQASPNATALNNAPFTGQMVSQALFGLQLMDNRYNEVELLLCELVKSLERWRKSGTDAQSWSKIGNDIKMSTYRSKRPSTNSMNMLELCNALYGLRSMSNTSKLRGNKNFDKVPHDISESEDFPIDDQETELLSKTPAASTLLQCLLDRSNMIYKALHEVESKPKQAMKWIQMKPMHMAHALYGIHHFGPHALLQGDLGDKSIESIHQLSDSDHDIAAKIVALLHDVREAQEVDVKEGSLLQDWTPFQLHDCLYGLLSYDVSNIKARKLLDSLLVVALAMFNRQENGPSRQQGTKEKPNSQSMMKLFQVLLLWEGRALLPQERSASVNSALSRRLFSRLRCAIELAERSCVFPPYRDQSSPSLHLYSRHLEEIVEHLDCPAKFNERGYAYRLSEDRQPRGIRTFYNVYLHGFHADIVLVGYYKPHEEGSISTSTEQTHHAASLYYAAGSFYEKCVSCEKSLFEEFVTNAHSKDKLIVVNIEIDGQHKNIVGNKCRDFYRDNFLFQKYNIFVDRINITKPHLLDPMSRLGETIDFILQ